MKAGGVSRTVLNRARGTAPLFLGMCLGLIGWSPLQGRAAVTDFLPDEAARSPRYVELSPESERRAKAISYFMDGLLDEETFGPEKAFGSFRKVLDLDPGYVDLAIKVAHEHLRRGESAEALAVLKDALKASPRNQALCLALSSVYLRQLGKAELAIQYANRALELAPKDFSSYEALWEIHQAQGNKRKAMQVLDRAARVNSENPDYWVSLGDFLGRTLLREDMRISMDDVTRMTAIFEKAARFGSLRPDVLVRVAYFYILSQQEPKAIPLLEKALELQPGLDDARTRLAGCYIKNGQYDEAIRTFVQLSESNPLDSKIHDALAELYGRKKNWERAASALQQGVLIEPDNPERQRQLALLLLDYLHRPAQAETLLADAMKRFPSFPEFGLLYAVALSQSGKHDQSLRTFERMEIEFSVRLPDFLNGDFYFNYGAAAEQAGKIERAVALLKKSIECDPARAARAYNYIGYMWVDRGQNLVEAEGLIRKALELEPDNGAFVDSLGWAYYQMGKYDDALRELHRAAGLLELPDAVVLEHIGDTQHKLGNHAQALIYWRKAIELDPENKKILAKIDDVAACMAKQPAASTSKR